MGHLEEFSHLHGIKIVTVSDIITYRRQHEKLTVRAAEARVPTAFGEFTAISYKSKVDTNEHVALLKGTISRNDTPLVRVHSECLTGDVFNSIRCDCGEQPWILP